MMPLKLSDYKPYVLAVDDEPLNRLILEDLIENRFELQLVDSGQACLDTVKMKEPDLILLDINMPGLSGYEVCQALKANPQTSHIPIIFLTAKISTEDERTGLKLGAVDYITKPFTESILLARMKTHLSLHYSRKLLEKNHKALQQERNYIEHLINSMRRDKRFESRAIRQLVSPVEASNGDIILSAINDYNHQHILVGDFTGHGLMAAIAGPLVASLFYTNVRNNHLPTAVLRVINDELCSKLPPQNFLAATYIDWDKNSEQVSIWNFGMPSCLYLSSEDLSDSQRTNIQKIDSMSVALGIIECDEHKVDPATIQFTIGDKLFIFTDGLAEVMNADGEAFGVARTIEALFQIIEDDLELNEILQRVTQFSEGKTMKDDTTLIEISA